MLTLSVWESEQSLLRFLQGADTELPGEDLKRETGFIAFEPRIFEVLAFGGGAGGSAKDSEPTESKG